jgi:ribosomal protein L12E/L44/L45/RPP1/RPP2
MLFVIVDENVYVKPVEGPSCGRQDERKNDEEKKEDEKKEEEEKSKENDKKDEGKFVV